LAPVNIITGNGKDSLWMGTDLDLELVDLKAGKVTHFQSNPSDSNSLGLALITAVVRDPSGNIWIGSVNSPGLDYYDLRSRKFFHLLRGLAVIAIFQDSWNNLWAGTDDGLYKIDKQLVRTEKYKFPGNINPGAVTAIGEDKDGNLWMGTSMGICRVNFRNDQAKIFAAESGVNPDELITAVTFDPRAEELYISSFNGDIF
jgi:ligand-binding sensor domain-containing protein